MDKLEKHIRQKLSEREVPPSPEAWNRISDALGEEKVSSNTKKRSNYWVGIAASFAALVVLYLTFWNIEDSPKLEEKVVTTQKDMQTGVAPASSDTQEDAVIVVVEVENSTSEAPVQEGKPTKDSHLVDQNDLNTLVAEAQEPETNTTHDPLVPNQERSPADIIIEKALGEVLAQVTTMESNQQAVTEAEIDSLLLAAQKEVLADKIFQESGKVNALALLSEVEQELDQSFRDQLFDKLKAGFFKLRTAVADRNN